VLNDVRSAFNIPNVTPGDHIEELLGEGEEIDWKAVRRMTL
jgi:hypothetical protein